MLTSSTVHDDGEAEMVCRKACLFVIVSAFAA